MKTLFGGDEETRQEIGHIDHRRFSHTQQPRTRCVYKNNV
jgi:hypothetical protein